MLRPCSSEIDDGLSLAGQYGGRGRTRVCKWEMMRGSSSGLDVIAGSSDAVQWIQQSAGRRHRSAPWWGTRSLISSDHCYFSHWPPSIVSDAVLDITHASVSVVEIIVCSVQRVLIQWVVIIRLICCTSLICTQVYWILVICHPITLSVCLSVSVATCIRVSLLWWQVCVVSRDVLCCCECSSVVPASVCSWYICCSVHWSVINWWSWKCRPDIAAASCFHT